MSLLGCPNCGKTSGTPPRIALLPSVFANFDTKRISRLVEVMYDARVAPYG